MPRQRLIAAFAAAYTVVVTSGAPLPMASLFALTSVPAASEERFPCESCPCGCGTAEHCWKQCCCHTLPERLAWARREGVRPPESALDAAEQSGLDIRVWRPDSVQLAAVVEVTAKELADLPACCKARRERMCEKSCCQVKPKSTPSKPGVSIIKAMACQGLTEAWLAFGSAPLPPTVEYLPPNGISYANEFLAPLWCHFEEAPVPPPPERLAAV